MFSSLSGKDCKRFSSDFGLPVLLPNALRVCDRISSGDLVGDASPRLFILISLLMSDGSTTLWLKLGTIR